MPTVRCPTCRRALNLPTAQQGNPARCPLCQTTFETPDVEPPPSRALPVAAPVPEARPRPATDDPSPFDFDDLQPTEALSSDDRLALASAVRWLKTHAAIGILAACTCNCLTVFSLFDGPGLLGAILGIMLLSALLIVVYIGAEAMERRRNHGLAMTAGVLALLVSGYLLLASSVDVLSLILPGRHVMRRGGVDPSFLGVSTAITLVVAILGLVGGVKTLMVLMKPEVWRAFRGLR